MTFTQSEIRQAVQDLEVIPSDPRVALQLIELARTEASAEDYAHLIGFDPSLTARLLGIVNCAWYSPNAPVQDLVLAVGMLGVPQVRMIALSHSVANLHQGLAIDTDEPFAVWRGSVCKAIAARKVAECLESECREGSYAAGLIQDLGLGLLYSIDPAAVRRIHETPDIGSLEVLQAEQDHFGLDHASVGGMVGQKLDLPMLFMHSVTCHHGSSLSVHGAISTNLPCRVASAIPHNGHLGNRSARVELQALIESELPRWRSAEQFMEEVHDEFAELDASLGQPMPLSALMQSLAYASQEYARSATESVSHNIWLREGKTSLHQKLSISERAQQAAEQRADRDPLTQLYNRSGWDRRARQSLDKSSDDTNLGVAFFDLDHFKQLNDEHGHSVGDAFLKAIGQRMQEATRASDIVCRWGGDEFVVLFVGGDPGDCLRAAQRVQARMQQKPIIVNGIELPVSASVGFVSVGSRISETNLGDLLQLADEELYKAKDQARGSLCSAVVNCPD